MNVSESDKFGFEYRFDLLFILAIILILLYLPIAILPQSWKAIDSCFVHEQKLINQKRNIFAQSLMNKSLERKDLIALKVFPYIQVKSSHKGDKIIRMRYLRKKEKRILNC